MVQRLSFTQFAARGTVPEQNSCDGYIGFSSVEADGYINLDSSELPYLVTASRPSGTSGIITLTFTATPTKITGVHVTAVKPTEAAVSVEVVTFSTTSVVLRWVDLSDGSEAAPALTDGISFTINYQQWRI